MNAAATALAEGRGREFIASLVQNLTAQTGSEAEALNMARGLILTFQQEDASNRKTLLSLLTEWQLARLSLSE